MNKRQIKKRKEIIEQRASFFGEHIIWNGRRNWKTQVFRVFKDICLSKKYKPFKQLKRRLKNLYFGFDISTGKDYSAMVSCRVRNNITEILGCKIID